MKITKITKISQGLYAHVCPLCGAILASASEPDIMPEFSVCDCDEEEEKDSVYDVFTVNGRTMIRRNAFPRFTGEVTMGINSDTEHIVWHDKCSDVIDLAKALRKAGEFLRKRAYIKKNN